MKMRFRLIATAFSSALALSACGGGGASVGSTVPAPGSSSGPSAATAAMFVITVPSASTTPATAQKRPQYVSSNTGSVRITLQSVNGTPSATANSIVAKIASGASGCNTTTQGLSCTISLPAPAGTDMFAVSTYQSSDGSGAVLASSAVGENVSSSTSASSAVTLSLGGVAASVAFSPARLPLVVDGNIHRFAVAVNAADASGATIVGASAYQSPVTLQIQNDPAHALTLSTASVSQPGTIVTVTYDSSKQLASGQIIASDNAMAPVTLYASPLTVNPLPIALFGTSALGVTLSEAGFTGTFTASVGNTSDGSANDGSVSITPGTLNSGTVVANITPKVRFDVTTLNVSDGNVTTGVPLTIAPQHGNYTPYGAKHTVLTPSNSFIATPDGTLWTGDLSTGSLVAFNASTGTYTTHVVDANRAGPQTLAADAAGNIWFADDQYGIGEYVPGTGTVSIYSANLLTTPGQFGTTQITTIIPGPANSNVMYFYDMGMNNIARTGFPSYMGSISTSGASLGTITEYQLTSGALPLVGGLMPMVVGSDNAIWYADAVPKNGFGIERFDPQNPTAQVTPIPISTPAAPQQVPMQLAVANNNKIYALTLSPTSGTSMLVSVTPTSGTNAPNITYSTNGVVPGYFSGLKAASDGNLYFAEQPFTGGGLSSNDLIGIINPNTNAVYEYPVFLPQYSVINGLVDDFTHQNLWMFDYANGQVGKVTLK